MELSMNDPPVVAAHPGQVVVGAVEVEVGNHILLSTFHFPLSTSHFLHVSPHGSENLSFTFHFPLFIYKSIFPLCTFCIGLPISILPLGICHRGMHSALWVRLSNISLPLHVKTWGLARVSQLFRSNISLSDMVKCNYNWMVLRWSQHTLVRWWWGR